ncbi:MAG: hypothetical protein ACOC0P_08020, partial [Planctomycetota bacterium]
MIWSEGNDRRRGVTVILGGLEGNETWEWNGTNWTLRTFDGEIPTPRWSDLAYDSSRGVCVLAAGEYSNRWGDWWRTDTWEYDWNEWQRRSNDQPGLYTTMALNYVPPLGMTVLSGKHVSKIDTTPLWDGERWH